MTPPWLAEMAKTEYDGLNKRLLVLLKVYYDKYINKEESSNPEFSEAIGVSASYYYYRHVKGNNRKISPSVLIDDILPRVMDWSERTKDITPVIWVKEYLEIVYPAHATSLAVFEKSGIEVTLEALRPVDVKKEKSVLLFDLIKAIITSRIDETQKRISTELGIEYKTLDNYKSRARKQIKRYGRYFVSSDVLDSIEFNILNNPFFSDLGDIDRENIIKVLDEYRIWAYSSLSSIGETGGKGGGWRYRPHRSGYSEIDIAVRKKMWLLRELQAAYTHVEDKITDVTTLAKELFGEVRQTTRLIANRFYTQELETGTVDLSIQTYLNALVSVMISTTIVDRQRALNALYDYGKTVYGFDLNDPTHRLLVVLFCAFRNEPTITGVFSDELLSLSAIADMMRNAGEGLGTKTLTGKMVEDVRFERRSVDILIRAIGKMISDSDIKAYAQAYLMHYKEKYAREQLPHSRRFILDNQYAQKLTNKDLVKYLASLTTEGEVPSSILSQDERKDATRVSSFNRRLTYILSDIKSKFITKLLGTKIAGRAVGQWSTYKAGKYDFIDSLCALSSSHSKDADGNRRYDPKTDILGHGSPPHELVLPVIVNEMDEAIACEFAVYWEKTGLDLLLGHVDLLLVKDGVLYVCDYKPDQKHSALATPSSSFINSVPQIATYALILKKRFRIDDIKCITFNQKGAWLYDPQSSLEEINDFMIENREGTTFPWTPYLLHIT